MHTNCEIGIKKSAMSDNKNIEDLQNQQEDVKYNNSKTAIDQVSEHRSSLYDQELKYGKIQTNKNENPNILGCSNSSIKDLCETCSVKEQEEEQNMKKANNNTHSAVNLNSNMAEKSVKNTREKTPMCLINDLARFNKIPFQYRLTSENGPAHSKRFTVTLKLGDEEYIAEGFKIKMAQHLAAKEAIEKTKYKHPTPKINRRNDNNNKSKSNITPTVELNALAMKLGQQTYYIFDPREMPINENSFMKNEISKRSLKTSSQLFAPNSIVQQSVATVNNIVGTFAQNLTNNDESIEIVNQNRQFLSKCQNRFSQFKCSFSHAHNINSLVSSSIPTCPCKITLIVGTNKFVGVGRTLQQAKHNAASNALQVLKQQIISNQIEIHNESFNNIGNKSPISLVFEIGIKRNLPVDFKVLREEGPAHMRTFITACIVGDIITKGEGTGKKFSKKKAALEMLEELKKLPPLTSSQSPLGRDKLTKAHNKGECEISKSINLADSKEDTKHCLNKNKKVVIKTDATNPIITLYEWHQSKKEKKPTFRLISEYGKENARRRQFLMEVSSNKIVARGVGNSKKLAKQDAAQNFLIAIKEKDKTAVYSENSDFIKKAQPLEVKPNNETSNCDVSSNTFQQIQNCNQATKTLDPNAEMTYKQENVKRGISESSSSCVKNSMDSCSNFTKTSLRSQNLYMKDQLLYLANLLGFEVDFSDYPKGNHNEFLTIVMLSTNPPQICHGVGINAKESQEDAAKNALKILSEMGLNNAVKET